MNIKKYFQSKSVEDLVTEATISKDLIRTFGPIQLIVLGVGAIIGAGIFVLTGEAASQYAGPAIVLSFAFSGLACVCTALCYAELASMIPVSGSAYTYIYATLGELSAWIVAGLMTLSGFLTIASVAEGWSGYASSFLADFSVYIPAQLSATTGSVITLADGTNITAILNLPAFIIVMLITVILYYGVKISTIISNIVVLTKMSVLIAFIILGYSYIDPNNWVPFIPENQGKFGEFGFSGILSGSAMVLLAYNGFDAVATTALETKNPQRNLPIGILGALITCTITYIIISGLLTGMVHYTELKVAQPIAVAVDKMHMPWFALIVKVGAICGLTSVILTLTYGLIRVLFVVTKDGLLPQIFAKVHKKHRTPSILTIFCGIFISIFSAIVPLDKLVQLANFGSLCIFTTVCFAAIYLRYSQPELKRVFKCPLMPIIPILGIILLLWIIYSLPYRIYLYAGIWIIIMLCFYFTYGQYNSKLLHSTKKL